jgi:serine/threonine-protein kinase
MRGAETHTSLAVLWSGPGLARSVVIASSPGAVGYDPWDAADTVISADRPDQSSAEPQPKGQSPGVAGLRMGRYRLIERLGRGCQGDVWRAAREDAGSGQAPEVALKLLAPNLARDPRRLAQFRREAERRARLGVPSVLPTTEYGESDGTLFMAMPLVDGCSLGEVIGWRRRDISPLPLHETTDPRHPLAEAVANTYLRGVVHALARVARTVDHVHAARVVHRDIKPANILLDRHRAEGIFLCDFGLARDLDVATPEQLRDGAGSPLYMAPERLLRLLADEVLCDIYALGATLYEAVTLMPPVPIPESLPWPAWTTYLAKTEPVPPRSVRPEIPESLEAIILRAMARPPEKRYPAAAELARDLESFLDCGSDHCSEAKKHRPGAGLRGPHFARGHGHAATSGADQASADTDTDAAWPSAGPSQLCHPDLDAWKIPIAAE